MRIGMPKWEFEIFTSPRTSWSHFHSDHRNRFGRDWVTRVFRIVFWLTVWY
jgi:hypothetical protein